MPRVFVSYRREDTSAVAARLAARLKDDLRLENVFLDRADIGAGWRWRRVLNKALRSADAVLVLVGAAWAGADGRRIHARGDMVAWELRQAIALSRDLVPTMVDGARWPDELPGDLAVLRELNFVDLNPADSPLGYLELLGDLFYKSVRRHGDVVVAHDGSDTAEVHVRKLAGLMTSGVPVEDVEQLVRAATRGFAAIRLGEAAARWPEVVVLVGDEGMTPALAARRRGLERNGVVAVLVPAVGIAGFVAGRINSEAEGGPPGDEGDEPADVTVDKGGSGTGPPKGRFAERAKQSDPPPPVPRWLTVAGGLLATVIVIGLGAGVATGWVRWPPWPTPTPSPSPSVSVSPSETPVVPTSLTVNLTSSVGVVRWGDPPFRIVARTSERAITSFTTEGPCRIDPIGAGEPTTEAGATVAVTGAGTCDLTATAQTSGKRQKDRLSITVGRARPVIRFDDASVPLTRPFEHRVRATVQPALPLTYATESPGCAVRDDVLSLVSTLSRAAASRFPVQCVVEASVAESANVEASDPVAATMMVTVPDHRLTASPSSTRVRWKEGDDANPPSNDVSVTLTEPSGLSRGVSGESDSGNCFVGKANELSDATRFSVVVSLLEYPRPEGYTCTIDWVVDPFPGADAVHATTTITVLPP